MKLTKDTRDCLEIGDILKDKHDTFVVTNIFASGRCGNGKSVTIKWLKSRDGKSDGYTIYGYPMSKLYGLEIIKDGGKNNDGRN